MFRDSLVLERGPRRHGGGENKNRETKVIHGANRGSHGRWEQKGSLDPMEHPSILNPTA